VLIRTELVTVDLTDGSIWCVFGEQQLKLHHDTLELNRKHFGTGCGPGSDMGKHICLTGCGKHDKNIALNYLWRWRHWKTLTPILFSEVMAFGSGSKRSLN